MINLDDFTEIEDERLFRLEQMPSMSYEKDKSVQMEITVEMNLDQVVIARDGYTILDFISDIGGMQGMLISGAALVLTIWNYNHLENFIVTKLYRLSSSSLSLIDDDIDSDSEKKRLKPRPMTNFVDYICEKVPSSVKCCCR